MKKRKKTDEPEHIRRARFIASGYKYSKYKIIALDKLGFGVDVIALAVGKEKSKVREVLKKEAKRKLIAGASEKKQRRK